MDMEKMGGCKVLSIEYHATLAKPSLAGPTRLVSKTNLIGEVRKLEYCNIV